ncbi:hypothetical protein ACIRU3_08305 [Streptomyces sp. NPDC101151]|uniref:hypothetical protein n=1 Tax=Streptomyces sp. NPDC101151 TaxID=3366115 RepID=UPI003810F571
MSFHDYCLGSVDTCVTNGLDRAVLYGVAGVVTEFGATENSARLTRLADRFDDNMASWTFWSQPQNQTPSHPQEPPTGPSLMDPAIVRPYPRAIAGTPQQWHYDSASGTFTIQYSARRADSGQPFASGARTEVYLPQSNYPSGYRVESQGADVLSSPDARLLQLTTNPGQDSVQVTVTPR